MKELPNRGKYSYDGMTDNDVRWSDYFSTHVIIRAGQITPDNNPISWGWNNTCFNFARAINIGLANYDNADIEQSIIDKYKAEARLFRGGWLLTKYHYMAIIHG